MASQSRSSRISQEKLWIEILQAARAGDHSRLAALIDGVQIDQPIPGPLFLDYYINSHSKDFVDSVHQWMSSNYHRSVDRFEFPVGCSLLTACGLMGLEIDILSLLTSRINNASILVDQIKLFPGDEDPCWLWGYSCWSHVSDLKGKDRLFVDSCVQGIRLVEESIKSRTNLFEHFYISRFASLAVQSDELLELLLNSEIFHEESLWNEKKIKITLDVTDFEVGAAHDGLLKKSIDRIGDIVQFEGKIVFVNRWVSILAAAIHYGRSADLIHRLIDLGASTYYRDSYGCLPEDYIRIEDGGFSNRKQIEALIKLARSAEHTRMSRHRENTHKIFELVAKSRTRIFNLCVDAEERLSDEDVIEHYGAYEAWTIYLPSNENMVSEFESLDSEVFERNFGSPVLVDREIVAVCREVPIISAAIFYEVPVILISELVKLNFVEFSPIDSWGKRPLDYLHSTNEVYRRQVTEIFGISRLEKSIQSSLSSLVGIENIVKHLALDLADFWESSSSRARLIWGASGSGKTEVAQRLAGLREGFPGLDPEIGKVIYVSGVDGRIEVRSLVDEAEPGSIILIDEADKCLVAASDMVQKADAIQLQNAICTHFARKPLYWVLIGSFSVLRGDANLTAQMVESGLGRELASRVDFLEWRLPDWTRETLLEAIKPILNKRGNEYDDDAVVALVEYCIAKRGGVRLFDNLDQAFSRKLKILGKTTRVTEDFVMSHLNKLEGRD